MDFSSLAVVSPSTLGMSGALALMCLGLYLLYKPKSRLPNLPRLGKESDTYFHNLIVEGYQKYPNTPYMIPDVINEKDTLILPQKYINEIKNLPESELSFNLAIYHRLEGKYTTIGASDRSYHVMTETVRVDLTRNIARSLESLQDEADYAIPECIEECKDWTPIQFYTKVLRVIALLSGRVFVGLPLCRNEEWISTTINFTLDAFNAVEPVKRIHPLIRPFLAPRLPQVRRIREQHKRGATLMKPIIDARIAAMKDPEFKPPTDMIQFVINNIGPEGATDTLLQSYLQMNLSLAAIHTTAMNITHVVYNLATYPEYQEPLREELKHVLADDGGRLVKTSIVKLRKMDSFIKESQRLSPPNALGIGRLALRDIHLSDGFTIPAGTHIAFPSLGINMDPTLYPDPTTFHGFRFSDLRSQPGNENKYQFVTTGTDAISFGHGFHACPGRFFASNEIKVIMAGLLLRYEMRLREGEDRPANWNMRTSIGPNRMAEVLFKRLDA